VDKDISAVFLGNESKTLGVIEPFHGSVCHSAEPPSLDIEDNGNVAKKAARRTVFAASWNKDFRTSNEIFP
jgi:hypothetical protein